MQLVNPRRYSNIAHITKYTSEYIQSFYESLDPDNYSYYEDYESEWTQRHIANMKESMEALLIAYLGMTSEEARSMPELSRGNRALLVERSCTYEDHADALIKVSNKGFPIKVSNKGFPIRVSQ